jgi:carboxypeptidase family protein
MWPMRFWYPIVALSVLGCAGCVATPGYEMPTFKGAVLDSMTNAPIANAQVLVTPFGGSGLAWSAVSDASGRFEVAKPRRYSLKHVPFDQAWIDARIDVSANGYEPRRVVMLDLTKRYLPDIIVPLMPRNPAPAP